jgi:hypothetical protein
VKRLGLSSSSRTTKHAQRSPMRSRAWAAHPSSYVRLFGVRMVAMPELLPPEVLICIYSIVLHNLLIRLWDSYCMLQPLMLQPQETESKAMTERRIGTCEERIAAYLGLLEREKETTHG